MHIAYSSDQWELDVQLQGYRSPTGDGGVEGESETHVCTEPVCRRRAAGAAAPCREAWASRDRKTQPNQSESMQGARSLQDQCPKPGQPVGTFSLTSDGPELRKVGLPDLPSSLCQVMARPLPLAGVLLH